MPHIHEKIDFTVEVFIVYNNKVLLRKHDKYGIWLSVDGPMIMTNVPFFANFVCSINSILLKHVLHKKQRHH